MSGQEQKKEEERGGRKRGELPLSISARREKIEIVQEGMEKACGKYLRKTELD